MNVLITSASRKVGLVKAFQRALSMECGGEVIAVDVSPQSAALKVADKQFLVPRNNDENFFSTLINICKKNNVSLIIPTRDEELPFFASKKKFFADLGITVMVSDPDVIEICRDKQLFNEFCKKNDFAIPETFEISRHLKFFDFPLFIRERYGKGSKYAFPVYSQDEMQYFLKKMKDPILQEFVTAPEYTVDLFSDFSGKIISVIPRKRIHIFGGESFIGVTRKNSILMNECIRLGHALRLIGHTTIQCFFDEKTLKFIEVNPRYGGAANLGFAAGACTPHYLVRLVMGKEVLPMVGEFKDNLMMLRYTEDIFVNAEEVCNIE